MLAPPPRLEAEELLDAEGHDLAELEHSLGQVARVDRILGGERGVRRALRGLIDTGVRPTSILDIGAGSGEVTSRVGAWLARDSVHRPTLLAVDLHPDVVAVGSRAAPGLHWLRADGGRLPLASDSVDVVLSVLTLHHLDADGARRLLSEAARVARRAVIISDLERSRLHHLGARLLAATVWRSNRLTRADAPMSVRRAWTAAELDELMRSAGLTGVRVRRYLPWRLVATGHPASAAHGVGA
jgi:SAM-dependent methyltransferase